MSYRANVINVMIASPSDVPNERQQAKNVILDWNAIHSKDRSQVLMPVGWESHSSPEMGDRPQTIINKQILRDCDILIAVFWTKLGTPTGDSPSGTAEEIREHVDAGKPALIYVSKQPVVMDSVDHKQYKALKNFETELRDNGLIEYFDSIAEFREKLTRQLAQTVIRSFATADDDPEEDGQFLRAIPTDPTPQISEAAQELLVEAAKDNSGTIMLVQFIGGTQLQTNGRQFIQDKEPRTTAKWRGAVDELESVGLVEDRNGKHELFSVTNAGYEVAELLDEL